ncbi:SirB2 family protein [Lysobacter arvi]|uniref:SirB2 family protein n=1 Tax=Lysobacter arvi TaxID=3038776 RepID=A0ABU1CE05_9GAMM|nr:SirB2 family protein [Lysobacter arvi]MDR0183403.1 SirB2 family protein [Lysobacter arvi]
MFEFYPQIKLVHIAAIACSGVLFFLRGSSALAGMRWPMAAPVRYLSYAIDTVLLTAAMMLLTILPGAFFANGWLLAKVLLVVLYVVLGIVAMRARRTRIRVACFLLAMIAYAQIYAIARAHDPLGMLHSLT